VAYRGPRNKNRTAHTRSRTILDCGSCCFVQLDYTNTIRSSLFVVCSDGIICARKSRRAAAQCNIAASQGHNNAKRGGGCILIRAAPTAKPAVVVVVVCPPSHPFHFCRTHHHHPTAECHKAERCRDLMPNYLIVDYSISHSPRRGGVLFGEIRQENKPHSFRRFHAVISVARSRRNSNKTQRQQALHVKATHPRNGHDYWFSCPPQSQPFAPGRRILLY
jgi:hypothetical protein